MIVTLWLTRCHNFWLTGTSWPWVIQNVRRSFLTKINIFPCPHTPPFVYIINFMLLDKVLDNYLFSGQFYYAIGIKSTQSGKLCGNLNPSIGRSWRGLLVILRIFNVPQTKKFFILHRHRFSKTYLIFKVFSSLILIRISIKLQSIDWCNLKLVYPILYTSTWPFVRCLEMFFFRKSRPSQI